jgi:hypothetical protein
MLKREMHIKSAATIFAMFHVDNFSAYLTRFVDTVLKFAQQRKRGK